MPQSTQPQKTARIYTIDAGMHAKWSAVSASKFGDEIGQGTASFDGECIKNRGTEAARFAMAFQTEHVILFRLLDEKRIQFIARRTE